MLLHFPTESLLVVTGRAPEVEYSSMRGSFLYTVPVQGPEAAGSDEPPGPWTQGLQVLKADQTAHGFLQEHDDWET